MCRGDNYVRKRKKSECSKQNKTDKISTTLRTMVGNTPSVWARPGQSRKASAVKGNGATASVYNLFGKVPSPSTSPPTHSPMLCALASSSLCTPRCWGAEASEGTSLLWWYPATSGARMREQTESRHADVPLSSWHVPMPDYTVNCTWFVLLLGLKR